MNRILKLNNKAILLFIFIRINIFVLQVLLFSHNCTKYNIFFYQSFIYKHRGTTQKAVNLFIADRNINFNKLNCRQEQGFNGQIKTRRKIVDHEGGFGLCKFDLFVLTCTFDAKKYRANIPISIGFQYNKFKFAKLAEVRPVRPSLKKREFVVCASRIMSFEKWQILITALEVYRYLKVNLVVTHVQSAISAVFELMKLYERTGILAMRPGIKFPFLEGMPKDPNSQTEFNGQVLMAHDCFYAYRSSARFIALIDWDDLLITSFSSLAEAYNLALKATPTAAYFLVNKIHCNFVERKNPSNFNMDFGDLLKESGICSGVVEGKKMVVMPKRLRTFWIHYSRHVESDMTEEFVPTNHSMLIHLANSFEISKSEYVYPLLHQKLNTDLIANKFTDIIWNRIVQSNITSQLPIKTFYFEEYEKCHTNLVSYFKTMKPKLCLNYNLCRKPRKQTKCVVAESKFKSGCFLVPKQPAFFVHIRTSSKFITTDDGCE